MKHGQRGISVHPTALIAAVGCAVTVLTGGEGAASALLLAGAIGIHEAGHLVMARAVRVPFVRLRLDLLGARLQTEGGMSYLQEWWLSAGGPLFNFISVLLLLPLWLSTRCPTAVAEPLGIFIAASLGLGGLNLLPIETFDGGRMFACALGMFCEDRTAVRWSRWVSLLCLSVLWMLSVYVLLCVGRSLSMFVFSWALLWRGLLGENGE